MEDWANQTVVHPAGVALLLVGALVVMLGPRRWAPVAILTVACFAARQRIAVVGLDFDFIRLLLLVAWARVLMYSELRGFRWARLDTLVLVFWLVSSTMMIVRQASEAAFVSQFGSLIDGLGGYFVLRALVRGWPEVIFIAKAAATLSAPVAAFFVLEQLTGRNLFSAFGGVPPITAVRAGRLRAQGAFAHPILAGSFWAALLPIIAALWWIDWRGKALAVIGSCGSLLIVLATASSTPVAAVATACLGAAMFPLRRFLSPIRWGVVAMLIVGHFVKTKPIWHIFVYANIIGGSTGWHRYALIDGAIRHFDEWWLMGTGSTEHWGPGLWDVTNQYILEGVRGGLLSMLCFIAVVVRAFGEIGRLWRRWERDRRLLMMSWALGVSLFVHATVFLSVSYFGQIEYIWTLLLATIGSLAVLPGPNAQRRARAARRRARTASANGASEGDSRE